MQHSCCCLGEVATVANTSMVKYKVCPLIGSMAWSLLVGKIFDRGPHSESYEPWWAEFIKIRLKYYYRQL